MGMLKANYHTHTWRCNHAEANERAYVEAALEVGMDTLGFADHSPYVFEGAYYSGYRMKRELTDGYIEVVSALREEFRGRIDVHIGFEAEYYPKYFKQYLEYLEPKPYEYLLLGQHFGGNEIGMPPAGTPSEDVGALEAYYDQCMEALNTGAFSCWVHPDLYRFVGDEAVYRRVVRRACREAKGLGIPIEINLLGLGDRRHYPRETFWEEAAAVGNDVIIGWDAHSPGWMKQPELEARGFDIVSRLGLHRIDYLTLVRPHI